MNLKYDGRENWSPQEDTFYSIQIKVYTLGSNVTHFFPLLKDANMNFLGLKVIGYMFLSQRKRHLLIKLLNTFL